MNNLNQIEIQNIRHICGHNSNFCEKINYFKTLTNDQNVINVLDSLNSECTTLKSKLTNLL